MSLELTQSLILAVDALCFAEWVRRKAGPVAFYGFLFAACPAIGLACQAAGWLELVQPGKWMSVLVTGALTVPFLIVTFWGRSSLGEAAIRIERDRRARWAQEDVVRAARERAGALERAELRGRAYAVAASLEA